MTVPATALRALKRKQREGFRELDAAIESLEAEIKASKRRKSAVHVALPRPEVPGQSRESRKATKSESDREVYKEVRERDAGLCTVQLAASVLGECGGALQIDHQWGRGKEPTRVENCRMLCCEHHRRKTDSETMDGPSRLLWLSDFREWAIENSYYAEVAKAEGKIALERAQHPGRKAPF
jgi:5-methylcytosine-specific restriction endonuclease McrA